MNTPLPHWLPRSPNCLISLPFIVLWFFPPTHSLCVSHSPLPFFLSCLAWATQCISCRDLIVPNPGGKVHFADTAVDVMYSTVISVRPVPYNCQARCRVTWKCVGSNTEQHTVKCTLELFFHICWSWFGSNQKLLLFLLYFSIGLVWTYTGKWIINKVVLS